MVYGVTSVIRAIIVNGAVLFGLHHYSESAGCVVWMKLCEMLVRGEEDLALIGNDDDIKGMQLIKEDGLVSLTGFTANTSASLRCSSLLHRSAPERLVHRGGREHGGPDYGL
ncbi:hypothetical protein PI124_g24385 [Phytophthora idaei]|nr:hypothetical protein PI124_g24385 [Phytophthora idaei]